MVNFNYSAREIIIKIVYYGPGFSGKTTNLEYIHKQIPPDKRGKLLSLETEQDRTMFFDLLPVDMGTLSGFRVKVQLFTVPGQIKYEETRKLVLRSTDGVVFVADSQASMMDFNIESFKSMLENLKANNLDFETIPFVIQYNKQDLENLSPIEELDERLNSRKVPTFRSVATTGEGVMETYHAIIEKVMESAQQTVDKELKPLSTPRTRPIEPIGPDQIHIVSIRRTPVDLVEEKPSTITTNIAPASKGDLSSTFSSHSLAQQMEAIEEIRLRVDKLITDNHKIAAALKKILIQMNEISQKMDGD
ncbi:MAG: GTPase domain-containing protein [Deltaproteobacteria bacterium]|nr:GTPase domain-containing protein [Deltaproteobacteria bacterium]